MPENISFWNNLLNFCISYFTKQNRKHGSATISRNCFNSTALTTQQSPANQYQIKIEKKNKNLKSFANLVASKIEDGNLAISNRLLCNDDELVFNMEEVFYKLSDRHPIAAADIQHFKDPSLTTALQVFEKDILKAIRRFSDGSSSGGPDGLRSKYFGLHQLRKT